MNNIQTYEWIEYKTVIFESWQSNPVSNLAKFLIEVWSVDERALLDLWVKEVFIPSDKERAQEFLHLHSDVHGHGDYKVEKDHEGEEVCKHLQILK